MPAKWQQWFPFRIEAFKSSPAVRSMHPSARAGYIYLLAYAWQTDDCTIPTDDISLAEISELGDELWSIHGPRIMRKFDTVTVEIGAVTVRRARNEALYRDWLEAKRIFESRQKAADRTNNTRSPHDNRTVTVGTPSRSAYTRTGTRTEVLKTNTPLPPSRGEHVENSLFSEPLQEAEQKHAENVNAGDVKLPSMQLARIAWASAVDSVHHVLVTSVPPDLCKRPGFRDGYLDWTEYAFAEMDLMSFEQGPKGDLVLKVHTPDAKATFTGLDKYRTRWETALRRSFGRPTWISLVEVKP